MKKFSLINGIQVAGMSLIALAVIGSLTIRVANPASNSVLSDTTASINMYIIDGSKTLKEMPFLESGFPSFEGGAAALKVEVDPVAPAGSKVIFTTNDDCVLFSDAAGGGIYNQSKEDDINSLYLLAVGAVDDKEYEGDHVCKVTAVFTSSDSDINGQKRSITFTVKDNDEKTEKIANKNKQTVTNDELKTQDENNSEKSAFKFVDKDGNEIKKGSSKPVFEKTEAIIISGNTVPDGKVKLYIFSEPQEALVLADKNGDWEYTIENIEPGEHRVEAEITDPITDQTSERTQVLAFEIEQSTSDEHLEPVNNTGLISEAPKYEPPVGLYVAAGSSLVILVLGIIGLIVYKKRHPHLENGSSSETMNPSDGMGS